jgi:hypothetical protein
MTEFIPNEERLIIPIGLDCRDPEQPHLDLKWFSGIALRKRWEIMRKAKK